MSLQIVAFSRQGPIEELSQRPAAEEHRELAADGISRHEKHEHVDGDLQPIVRREDAQIQTQNG